MKLKRTESFMENNQPMFDAVQVAWNARQRAELTVFRAIANPTSKLTATLIADMKTARRQERFCLRTLLYLSENIAANAHRLRQGR
jgi:hypothetical protein